jgi:protoheme IX farnesyltransferase
MLKDYYRLIKPGIIYANVLTALAGYLYGSKWHITARVLVYMLIGTSLIIAAACIVNNFTDREIDGLMERTKNRALVTGRINWRIALVLATILLTIGIVCIAVEVNYLVLVIGLAAYVIYTIPYAITKRTTPYSTLVGSVPGAASITAGYCAYSDKLDVSALLLFLIMVFWQMPHFYAIGLRRLKDYKAAGLKIMPVVRGVRRTKLEMIIFSCLFLAANLGLSIFGETKVIYALVMTAVSVGWLTKARTDFSGHQTAWAKAMFFMSLKVLLIFCVMVSVGRFLP